MEQRDQYRNEEYPAAGLQLAAQRGYLAGFPVVDFRVILYDGSYHDVDSNELSFKTAGRIAFKKAMEQAKPTLLEPIMKVEITIPDEFAGSIMGDLNSRRGRIQGMENKAGKTIVKAEVPMAEMLTYGADLTSMTQGRGSFNMEMSHYDIVPQALQEKIITQAKTERGEVVVTAARGLGERVVSGEAVGDEWVIRNGSSVCRRCGEHAIEPGQATALAELAARIEARRAPSGFRPARMRSVRAERVGPASARIASVGG